MDLRKREQPDHSVAPKPDNGGAKPPAKKNALTWIMVFFVVPVMAVWESAKGLCRRAYDEGGFMASSLRIAIGVIAALAAGIGTGYYEGWINGWSWYAWLAAALLATVGTFVYVWPLLYLLVAKPIHVMSRELWAAVPERDQWFTELLMVLAKIAVLGAGAYVGWTQGGAALANLTGNGWGFFAYPGAFAWAVFTGVVVASFAWGIFTTTIYGVAAGTGLLLAYGLLPLTNSVLAGFGLVHPAWGWAAAAVEFVLWLAFLFPLVHVVASHGLRFVKDLCQKAYTNAYDKTVGHYEGVFTQLVNLWTAYHLASLTITYSAVFGLTLTGWMLWVVPAAVALLSYLLVGAILRAIGNRGLGIIAGAHVVRYSLAALAGFSLPWALAGTALAAVLTYFLVYPLVYVAVRAVGQYILNNSVAAYLVTAHDKACDAAQELVHEVARARKTTYGDESWFSKLFVHVANVGLLLPVWFYASGFVAGVGLSLWLSWTVVGLALALSYVLIGRLLHNAGTVVIGGVAALAGAVASGVLVYAHVSYGLWTAIPGGLFGGFLVAWWLFPVAYVFARFLVSLVDGIVPLFSKLLEPVFRGAHELVWQGASGLWQQFRETYRMVRDAIRPTWESISKAWSEAWQSVKDAWDNAKRRN